METNRFKQLLESSLGNVKPLLNESEHNERYYIVAYPYHLDGKGMFIYTGDGGYSMIPTSIEFRRKMHDEMSEPPKSYDSMKEALRDIKIVKRETKDRPELRWQVVGF
jgi:hypothetical protein